MTEIESIVDPYRALNNLSRKSVAFVQCVGLAHLTSTSQDGTDNLTFQRQRNQAILGAYATA